MKNSDLTEVLPDLKVTPLICSINTCKLCFFLYYSTETL